jgi:isoleucyl-tRNA synthetase
VLDRYILAKTSELVAAVTEQMDASDIAGACASVRSYLEVLTNWYIRRSRNRFWEGDADAIDTLHTVLEAVCRVVAPLLPLTSEMIWRGLTGGRSVHLTDWPDADDLPADGQLVAAMDAAREVASVALSLRKAAGLRVRQPLAAMTVSTIDPQALQRFSALLADEVNVKSVTVTGLERADERVSQRLSVNARAAGPRLGRDVQQVIKAAKSGDWSVAEDGSVVCGGVLLLPGEYTLELVASQDDSGALGLLRSGGYVHLDTVLDQHLLDEGTVGDLLRVVQQARKDAGLQVSDRISLTVQVSDGVWRAVAAQAERVRAETLAVSVDRRELDGAGTAGTVGDGETVHVAVTAVGEG